MPSMVGCPARFVHLHLRALRVQTFCSPGTRTLKLVKPPPLLGEPRCFSSANVASEQLTRRMLYLSDSQALLDDRSCV